MTKGEGGFQGEVGIYMGPKGVGWIPSRPLPYTRPEILKLISLKVWFLKVYHWLPRNAGFLFLVYNIEAKNVLLFGSDITN